MSNYLGRMTDSFQDELVKIALKKAAEGAPSGGGGGSKTLALMGAGALTFEGLRRANKDRRIGRQVRLQQGM